MESECNKKIKSLQIITGYKCNNGCIYCSIDEKLRNINLRTDVIKKKIIHLKKKYDPFNIAFTGGEPTIREDIFELINYSKKNNYKEIEIKSNGYIFYYYDKVRKLIDSGINIFNITYNCINEKIFEEITRIKDSQKYVLKGIKNIISFNKKIIINIPVTRINYKKIKDTIIFLNNIGINDFVLWHIRNEGRAKKYGKDIIVSINDLKYIYIEIFEYASKKNINIKSLFIPYCIFPEYKLNILNPIEENIIIANPDSEINLSKTTLNFGEKLKICVNCIESNLCFGIHKSYLELYGSDEFKPIM